MENTIWKALTFQRNTEESEIAKVLKKIPIFSELNNKEIDSIVEIIYKRQYSKGEAIFHKGEPGLGMYILIDGEIDIYDEESDELKNKLATLERYDFLGELSLLDESKRSATAIATKESEALAIFRPDLHDIFEKNNKLAKKVLFNLAKVIGVRLREANEKLANLKENG